MSYSHKHTHTAGAFIIKLRGYGELKTLIPVPLEYIFTNVLIKLIICCCLHVHISYIKLVYRGFNCLQSSVGALVGGFISVNTELD